MTLRLLILMLFSLGSWSVLAGQVSGLRVWADPDKTRAVLDLSDKAQYRLFTLKNPDRVVIDLDASAVSSKLKLDKEHSGVISGVRHGKPDAETLRVVLDLSESTELKSFLLEPTGQYGYRLVVDLLRGSSKQSSGKSRRVATQREADRDVVIAIDAGHGGEDPGAIGSKRTREKTVVLQIAKRLKKAVDAQPGMRGVLTREGDYYIPLRGRYERARKARADLFVSIHADAFKNPRVSGSSVFVLSSRGASSEFGRLLAQRENAADLVGGVTLNDKDDMLASVLLDLSQSATMEASNAVAEQILGSLKRNVKTHKPIVGRANFLVLKSPDVPSVLIETAFISNPSEERRLTQREFQQKMADSIAKGISRYFYNSPPPGTWIASNNKADRHIVSRGDTLGEIAVQYRVSVGSLKRVNNIRGDVIHVGKELVIPTT